MLALSGDNTLMTTADTAPGDSISPMKLVADRDACYRALLSRDNRFDGKFFVGVSSTRIYCRPVCKVKTPQKTNCSFFQNAVAAEQAGFRPCLRCRPEMAPGWSTMDISAQLSHAAAALIRGNLSSGSNVSEIAAKLGVSDRHLRRLFETHIGASPRDYLQTQRRLLAKRLLADTSLSISAVAATAGFGSSRAMNNSFQKCYGLTSSGMRGSTVNPSGKKAAAELEFNLPYREPFDFDFLLGFLKTRSIAGVEHVEDNSYQRVITVRDDTGELHTGWLKVAAIDGHSHLVLTVSSELLPVIASVLIKVRHIFDLDADPESVVPALGELAKNSPGIRLPGSADGFEIAVRAVLGQQITVKAARTLATRFVARFGAAIDFPGKPELTHAFPDAATIARARKDSIAKLGIIGRRADTIKHLAGLIDKGELKLSPDAPVEQTLAALKSIPGIGDWTAHYLCMRALHWPDAYPAADYGVMKALGVDKPSDAKKLAEVWRPWRAYAVMHLWASLKTAASPEQSTQKPSGTKTKVPKQTPAKTQSKLAE